MFLEYIQDSSEQIQHLSNTIDDFRNFFLPNKNKERTTLNVAIDNTLKIIGKSLENNKITIVQNLEDIEPFEMYLRELTQVLINILKNAKDALSQTQVEKKQIVISTYKESNNAIIQIDDNGGGIEESNLEKIFEPYFSTKGEYNGTGLGLYISKTILEKHFKGTLKVINITNGASFKIILPIVKEN